MKTVWHWNEIAKAIGLVVASGIVVSVFCALLNIPAVISGLLGFISGIFSANYAMDKWDLYHFK